MLTVKQNNSIVALFYVMLFSELSARKKHLMAVHNINEQNLLKIKQYTITSVLFNLNGDLLYWYEPLKCALEISSMGIRVDENSIVRQCQNAGCIDRLKLPYHQAVIHSQLPYTIGGGIGQSRLCMMLLKKVHIGEVQASIWTQEILDECAAHNIPLL